MAATLIVYSLCTGLGGLAQSWVDFTIYRFLAGLGIGGMFGAATTLVAESVPAAFRATALGALQALSATGNILGSLTTCGFRPERSWPGSRGWRVLFFVGVLPALLVVPTMFVLREPDAWIEAKARAPARRARQVGSPAELFRHPRWRRQHDRRPDARRVRDDRSVGDRVLFSGTDFDRARRGERGRRSIACAPGARRCRTSAPSPACSCSRRWRPTSAGACRSSPPSRSAWWRRCSCFIP